VLEIIFAFQISQNSIHQKKAKKEWISDPDKVLEELKNNPNNIYVLLFWGKDINNEDVWHAVIPYKVEGNKIYFWDNNMQYPNRDWKLSYKQYMEIISNWKWNAPWYERWKSFTKLSLINIDDIYNSWKKTAPAWFSITDILYTLSWSSNMYVTNSLWEISWFKDGKIFEEIEWVEVIIPINATLSWTVENNFKKIYLPEKQEDLKIEVSWDTEESYDLMIAWWDYYTKVSNVETSSWQTDTFEITKEEIKIDFDDSKTWNYDLIVDNFEENWTWSILIEEAEIKVETQQYDIDWNKVKENNDEAIEHKIDKDNDWNFDSESDIVEKLPAVSKEESEPLDNNQEEIKVETKNTWWRSSKKKKKLRQQRLEKIKKEAEIKTKKLKQEKKKRSKLKVNKYLKENIWFKTINLNWKNYKVLNLNNNKNLSRRLEKTVKYITRKIKIEDTKKKEFIFLI
jgi:hypothetical protein